VLYTAEDAYTSDDLRRIDLTDANLAFASETRFVHAHAGTLTLRGLPAWAQAAIVPPAARSALMVATGVVGASAAVWLILLLGAGGRRVGRIAAVVLGAAGPLAGLGCMRVLERSDAPAAAFAVLPLACALVSGAVYAVARRLPLGRVTATN
jgi:hypothetical protein